MRENASSDSQLHKVLPVITAQIVKNYHPERIILFGSLVNEETSSNDIDLFLIKDTDVKRHIDRVREIRKFLPNEIPIDLIVYTPQEVEDALAMRSYFIEDILNEGKLLYET
ncbi:MAG: nucleotidyltransferase domain-containing protein [Candidatus Cloacimonetes bacterium]|nr:nucleotidyltransferase domain-containing protein [Candidatus Cloacimonadota bacterium]